MAFTIDFAGHAKEAALVAADTDEARLETEALLAVEQCARMFPEPISQKERERVFGALDDAFWVLTELRAKEMPAGVIRLQWAARTKMRKQGVVGPITTTLKKSN